MSGVMGELAKVLSYYADRGNWYHRVDLEWGGVDDGWEFTGGGGDEPWGIAEWALVRLGVLDGEMERVLSIGRVNAELAQRAWEEAVEVREEVEKLGEDVKRALAQADEKIMMLEMENRLLRAELEGNDG